MKLPGSNEYIPGGLVPGGKFKSEKTSKKQCLFKYLDVRLGRFEFYRKYRKGVWYKHKFTHDALDLSLSFYGTFWARYGNINRYSRVIEKKIYL